MKQQKSQLLHKNDEDDETEDGGRTRRTAVPFVSSPCGNIKILRLLAAPWLLSAEPEQ